MQTISKESKAMPGIPQWRDSYIQQHKRKADPGKAGEIWRESIGFPLPLHTSLLPVTSFSTSQSHSVSSSIGQVNQTYKVIWTMPTFPESWLCTVVFGTGTFASWILQYSCSKTDYSSISTGSEACFAAEKRRKILHNVSRPTLSGRDNFTTCLAFFREDGAVPRLDTAGFSHLYSRPTDHWRQGVQKSGVKEWIESGKESALSWPTSLLVPIFNSPYFPSPSCRLNEGLGRSLVDS